MSGPGGGSPLLVAHLALLSLISFGGLPAILPDLHQFAVAQHAWLSDRDFADCFAAAQAVPGPNMIILVSLIGWKLGGAPAAAASAVAMFAPSCTVAFAAFRFWDRFRDAAWQQRARRGIAPVIIGVVIAGGIVMARTVALDWVSLAATLAAAALLLGTRMSPLWLIAAGGVLGAVGLL